MSWSRLLILTLLLTACLASVAFCKVYNGRYLKTEAFISSHMTNANGTLATYLTDTPVISPDLVHGREALSEATGLWLSYAAAKGDKELFEKHYAVFKQCFLTPEGFILWKLTPDGFTGVSTNALVDDLRIIDALLAADRKWNNQEWRESAAIIGSFLASNLTKNSVLVDFYDRKYKNSPDSLTLSYLNLPAIDWLGKSGILPPQVVENMYLVVGNMPTDGIFYPRTYDVKTRGYTFDQTANLIDQMLIALQQQYRSVPSDGLLQFLKQEFSRQHMINGEYDRQSRMPKGSFESPAVYALVILYSIEAGDREFAIAVYERMTAFRQTEGPYSGGYVSGGNTHIFDNLYPQIAELKMYKTYPLYFILN